MILIGLTGGIGSGKSTVCSQLKDRGAVVIDADHIAREVVEPGPILDRIVQRFGHNILGPDSALDRKALARIVFSDPDALNDLEEITHPAIRSITAAWIVQSREDGASVVVHDMPILIEAGLPEMYDLVVSVVAPAEVRLARAVARGMDAADVRKRMAAQASEQQQRAVADVVLENSGSLVDLTATVEDFVAAYLPDLKPRVPLPHASHGH